jgi:hypothetical protein
VEFKVEVQMFQIYRDALEDLLAAKGKREKGEDEDKKKPSLKIILAEHSPTGLVMVSSMCVLCPVACGLRSVGMHP